MKIILQWIKNKTDCSCVLYVVDWVSQSYLLSNPKTNKQKIDQPTNNPTDKKHLSFNSQKLDKKTGKK